MDAINWLDLITPIQSVISWHDITNIGVIKRHTQFLVLPSPLEVWVLGPLSTTWLNRKLKLHCTVCSFCYRWGGSSLENYTSATEKFRGTHYSYHPSLLPGLIAIFSFISRYNYLISQKLNIANLVALQSSVAFYLIVSFKIISHLEFLKVMYKFLAVSPTILYYSE